MVQQCYIRCSPNFQRRNDEFNFYETFIRHYDEDSDKEYILGVDIEYPKELHG